MNQQAMKAVKELTRKGCIVQKDAGEDLDEKDVELVEALDTVPMYLSLEMLQLLREQNNDHVKIRFLTECPDFIGTDLEEYGPFEEGDTAELPEDNAEILVNRGQAEEMNDDE